MSKNTRNRILLTAVAALLLVVVTIAGTLAYLQDSTDTVENKFTPSTLNIDLDETVQSDGEPLEDGDSWEAQVIPGTTLRKNPTVTVYADENNVKMYLFVKVDSVAKINLMVSSGVFADPSMFYENEDTWTLLANEADGDVYYAVIDPVLPDDDDTTDDNLYIELISGSQLIVNASATQTNIDTLFANVDDITISFTAYACQFDNVTVDQAWAAAKAASPYTPVN